MLETKLLNATFSAVSNSWEVATDSFKIMVRNLRVPNVEDLKTKHQMVRCRNCLFDLRDDWVVVSSYDTVELSSLW